MAMRSKYVGNSFGNWTCIGIGLANVQGRRSARPGTRNYFYTFERDTSDGIARKVMQLNSTEAAAVYAGRISVEELMDRREANHAAARTARRVQYMFIDRL